MTAEQWAQAEAERQRQAEMVQTLFSEVRRLGTEQSNNLQEIQRLRAEQLVTVPAVETPVEPEVPPPTTPARRGIIDTRIGKPPVFSGDESTWGDWSFKLRVNGRPTTWTDDGSRRAGSTRKCLDTE